MPAPALADFEKLGAFYLGRETGSPSDAPFLYDARHLTTHAVVVGMTGSGKTGLSIAMLEEAAIDGIPAIVVDPKGDLGNLLLSFPRLSPEEFAPWVTPGTTAADEAARWTEGLATWGQDGARIARLHAAADVALYTPGSEAGRPLSILASLACPETAIREDRELFRDRVSQVASSLLGLIGVESEAASKEHVLVATILQSAWSAGTDLDLGQIVVQINDPSFSKIGVLDVESFFPKKARFELAVRFNAVLAAPGFDAWLAGEPLDPAKLLWTDAGKPRISVLSIAHLGESERMFFVSLLLGQIVTWMRTQPGTPSLRALFFMDEIVGYFPPVAMPPSKPPLLMLLKQARAYGLGVVLATQNPVDLDYKGLSNTGTWFIGRLQTERDKARVLDGLEGASAAHGFDRSAVDHALSALQKRQFYLHDVHADRPVILESRWTMSYLRGPLTRDEVRRLAATDADATGPTGTVLMNKTATDPRPSTPPAKANSEGLRPVVPEGIEEVFFPTTDPRPLYVPWVLGAARVHFEDTRTGLDFVREVMFVTPVQDGPQPLRWEDARWAGPLALRELQAEPHPEARFAEPAPPLLVKKNFTAWSKELTAWLARTQGVARWKCPELKAWSSANEDERAFRARLALELREKRDAGAAAVREKFGAKLETLDERIRRAEAAVLRERSAADASKRDAALAVGSGLLGAFLGGGYKRAASSAAKNASKASKKSDDVARETENLAELRQKRAELAAAAQAAIQEGVLKFDPTTVVLENVVTKPKKNGITVHVVALAWRA